MSALLHEVGTPCPRRSGGSRISGESSGSESYSLWDDNLGDYDDTRNIDFTTEIKPPILTGAKPKRRTKTTTFSIHSDTSENQHSAIGQKRDIKPAIATSSRKTSLLAQPAQRFRPRVSFAPSPLKHSQTRDEIEPIKRTRPNVQKNNDLLKRISGDGDEILARDVLKKDVRRNTVYIPPEDTTVASVFMGIFSPLKNSNLESYMSENTQVGSLECQIARKRQAKQVAATSPSRPLQPSLKVSQESCNKVDIPGKNGGKENIPPGAIVDLKLKSSTLSKPLSDKLESSRTAVNGYPRANAGIRPLAARTANEPAKKVDSQKPKAPVSNTFNGQRPLNTRAIETVKKSSTASRPLRTSKSEAALNRNSLKHLKHDYPLASTNITNPALYDDDWLSRQEVILTQLANGLFHDINGEIPDDPAMLRQELLVLYQGPYFSNLHKRLQASLVYGALSIPKDVLLRNSRLRRDLGMKRKFIDMWLQTYEPNALRAALETVTGRVISMPKTSSSNMHKSINKTSDTEKPLARRIAKLLDTFLIQNQDMDRSDREIDDGSEVLAEAYRRTVLRSIMMVILLDKARSCSKTSLSGCLFLASSQYKSSFAVLKALARFLLPSCGDVGKALAQLDCHLTYEQHPLEEYDYEMSNLAVDLRDGVRLTRMVELLVAPPAIKSFSTLGNDEWPLSRQLKFPCLSRAVKLFNVNIALKTLACTKEGHIIVNNTKAADIVDGHREKTIALLWGLVSNWGLSSLVNMDDLKQEVALLSQKASQQQENGSVEMSEQSQSDEPAELLKHWASLVAHIRGLQPADLTMNLADGQIYECILDEYEECTFSRVSTSSEDKAPTEDRLRALGCSTQFVNIVSPRYKTCILNSHSATGALAFLCSRLLPVAKCVRAALILQNAWRRILDRREAHKRAVASNLARQCAAVVQTRDQILWAKSVILHWWRLGRTKRQRRNTVGPTKTKLPPKPGRKSTRIPLRCAR
ncbi:hypothetical protein BDV18DRAFT_138458 [Aspergillus unguis]